MRLHSGTLCDVGVARGSRIGSIGSLRLQQDLIIQYTRTVQVFHEWFRDSMISSLSIAEFSYHDALKAEYLSVESVAGYVPINEILHAIHLVGTCEPMIL
jgi:hypothetical protein